MKDSFPLHHFICQLALGASFWYGVPAVAVDWTITDLGTLGGTFSWATAINARGQVVGGSSTSGEDIGYYAFLHDGTKLRSLGALGTTSEAQGINARGQVVGMTSIGSQDFPYHAFLYDNTGMHDLKTLDPTNYYYRSWAYGISASGQVVGFSDANLPSGTSTNHAFLYDGSGMNDLSTFGTGISSFATGINVSGQMVGASTSSNDSHYHAFLYDATGRYDLGTLGTGTSSIANGINAIGQVVGGSNTSGDAGWHAFLYDSGGMHDLLTLGGTRSSAVGINARGQVVGESYLSGDITQHAFLYDGRMRDLSVLPEAAAAGWQSLDGGTAINDSGQIVGYGTIGGQTHAFRLHPQTTSRYMRTVNTTKLYNLGCAQTHQSGLLILDFGQPWVRNRGVYGTIAPGTTDVFFTLAQIETAMEGFLDGYYECPGKGFMTVAVGTNNFGSGTTIAHGRAWGPMVARLNNYISSTPGYRDRLAVAGASDIETQWNGPVVSRAWVDGYASTSQGVTYFNYGDANDCPTTGTGLCGTTGWTQADVWYVSWGDRNNPNPPLYPLPVPQIYYNAPPGPATHALRWATLATLYNNRPPMVIPGVLTQWQACQDPGRTCDTGYNTPVQAWKQMMDALHAKIPDPNAVQTVLFSSDITWQN